MSEPLVSRYGHHGWMEIALNRPERRNAVIGPMVDQLIEAIDAADRDSGLRVILLRGEGKAFCSGLDLKAFNAEQPPDWMPRFGSTWRRMPSISLIYPSAGKTARGCLRTRSCTRPSRPPWCTLAVTALFP